MSVIRVASRNYAFWKYPGKRFLFPLTLIFFTAKITGPKTFPLSLTHSLHFCHIGRVRLSGQSAFPGHGSPTTVTHEPCLTGAFNGCAPPEFSAVEIALFNSRRIDASRTAEARREQGREIPVLRETDAPEQIRTLIQELQEE
jgi:hypothetical protein